MHNKCSLAPHKTSWLQFLSQKLLSLIFIFQLNAIETELMELDEEYNNDQITLAAYASKNRSLQEWDRNNQLYSVH